MDDFSFYEKFAKPLVLELPGAKDRAMAALWIKKLSEMNSRSPTDVGSHNTCLEYLKLLLLAMQRDRLTGIFENPPPSDNLQDLLPPGLKAKDMISLTKTDQTLVSGETSITKEHPRVVISIGGDMCEYVAVQEIPNFGIHGYYAVSTEPLSKWLNHESSTSAAEHQISCAKSKDKRESMDTGSKDNENNEKEKTSKKRHEKTRHNEKSLQKLFQAQRSEIVGVETRPCWGRSRYIDRLIDESPHLVGDLDLSEADAMLYVYRDAKFRKAKKTGMKTESIACAISSRRRNVERRLDLPPCSPIPDEEEILRHEESSDEGSRTCMPKNLELEEIVDEEEAYDCDDGAESARPQGHIVAPCEYLDEEYESELRARTDYDSWRDYARESGDYMYDTSSIVDDEGDYSYITNVTAMTNDPDDVNDKRRLVEDPSRREPPSRGKATFPRRRRGDSVGERSNYVHFEDWDPPGHSTHIGRR